MKSFIFITLQVLISFFRSPKEAMGTHHIQGLLFLFLLGASPLTCMYGGGAEEQLDHRRGFWWKSVTWGPQRRANAYLYLIFSPVAQNLYCHKGISMSIEEDNNSAFNWTSEKVETCDNKALCQESVLMIKSGKVRKGQLGWVGRKVDYFLVKAVPSSPGQH